MYVSGPGGSTVRTRLTATGEGRYTATYTPEAVGRHNVQVSCAGRHVPGSPFTCNVYDVRRVRVTGLGPGGEDISKIILFTDFLRPPDSNYMNQLCSWSLVAFSAPSG